MIMTMTTMMNVKSSGASRGLKGTTMTTINWLVSASCLLLLVSNGLLAQDLQQPTANQGAAAQVSVNNNDAIKKLEQFKQSNYFVPLFDPEIIELPKMQVDFVNNMVVNDLELFREILRYAIDNKNKFAPSVGLMWKYTTKLLGRFISNRREEQKLPERIEPKPAFFNALADLAERVIARSAEVKSERGYTKKTVDTDELYRQVDNVFKYIQKTIEMSPVAAYLRWDEMVLFKNDLSNPDHDKNLIEETADLTARFRGMGYDNAVFVAKRIVKLLRMFSKGSIPNSDKDV